MYLQTFSNVGKSKISYAYQVFSCYGNYFGRQVLLRQNWENITKIYPYKQDRLIHMRDFFSIASHDLLGEPVICANGDIGTAATQLSSFHATLQDATSIEA